MNVLLGTTKTLKNNSEISNVFIKPLLAAVICCSVAFTIVSVNNSFVFILFSLCAAVLIYAILIIIFRVFSKEEIAEMPIINKLFNK